MRNTFIFFLLNILLVNITFSENEPVLTCPKSIICDYPYPSECKYSDNPHNSWSPLTNTEKKRRGAYKLRYTMMLAEQLGRPMCTYYLEGSRESIRVYFGYSQEKPNYFLPMSYFMPTKKSFSNWMEQTIQESQKNYICISDNPSSCEMTQTPEISIRNSIYNPNPEIKNPQIYYLYLSYPNISPHNSFSYSELQNICGTTSNCKIDIIGSEHGDKGEAKDANFYIGYVDLDLSINNVVKINQITTINRWTLGFSHIFKQYKPFNIIY